MGRQVDPLGHIILIPRQPIYALSPYINAEGLAEKQQIPIDKNVYTDKPVLRGHLWDNEIVAL